MFSLMCSNASQLVRDAGQLLLRALCQVTFRREFGGKEARVLVPDQLREEQPRSRIACCERICSGK